MISLGGASTVRSCWSDLKLTCGTRLLENVDFESYADKISTYGLTYQVFDEGNRLGAISLYANDIDTRIGYITLFAVQKASSGRGLGSFLMAKACEEARRRGMRKMRLEVRNKNVPAIRFYCARGFTEESEKAESRLMVLDLQEAH